MKTCADPPSRKELAKIVSTTMKNYRSLGEPIDSGLRRMAKAIKKNPPHQDWLLMVLGTIESEHPIFAKDYVAPKKVKK